MNFQETEILFVRHPFWFYISSGTSFDMNLTFSKRNEEQNNVKVSEQIKTLTHEMYCKQPKKTYATLAVVKKASRKKKLLETDDRREFGSETFVALSKSLNIKVGILYTSERFVFPERLIWAIRHLLKKQAVRTRQC